MESAITALAPRVACARSLSVRAQPAVARAARSVCVAIGDDARAAFSVCPVDSSKYQEKIRFPTRGYHYPGATDLSSDKALRRQLKSSNAWGTLRDYFRNCA